MLLGEDGRRILPREGELNGSASDRARGDRRALPYTVVIADANTASVGVSANSAGSEGFTVEGALLNSGSVSAVQLTTDTSAVLVVDVIVDDVGARGIENTSDLAARARNVGGSVVRLAVPDGDTGGSTSGIDVSASADGATITAGNDRTGEMSNAGLVVAELLVGGGTSVGGSSGGATSLGAVPAGGGDTRGLRSGGSDTLAEASSA